MKRYDILAALLAPLVAFLMYWFFNIKHQLHSFEIGFEHIVVGCLICVAVAGEIWFMREQSPSSGLDKGVLSAFLVSSGSVIVLIYSLVDSRSTSHFWLALTALVIISGCLLRVSAKLTLKEHFSHSLRLLDNHQLVTSGPYRVIRHPAYLGTMLIVSGIALMLVGFTGLIVLPFGLFYCVVRIHSEEKLLTNRFGKNFHIYQQSSRKLLPFIW